MENNIKYIVPNLESNKKIEINQSTQNIVEQTQNNLEKTFGIETQSQAIAELLGISSNNEKLKKQELTLSNVMQNAENFFAYQTADDYNQAVAA